MQCNKCGNEAIFFQDYSGQHLCRRHFVADVETKAKRSIRTHHWLRSGDHLAVAISGDPQSRALLYFLKKLTADRRDIRITAISIDEGVGGSCDPGQVRHFSESLGIPYVQGSFIEEFGITAAEIARRKGKENAFRYRRALRSCLLTRIALRNGITRIALGITLDERALEILTTFLGGEARRLLDPGYTTREKIPWISPFIAIPLGEVKRYADLFRAGLIPEPTHGDPDMFQHDVAVILDSYCHHHPATKYALVNLGDHLSSCEVTPSILNPCIYHDDSCDCLCEACRLIGEVTDSAA